MYLRAWKLFRTVWHGAGSLSVRRVRSGCNGAAVDAAMHITPAPSNGGRHLCCRSLHSS